MEKTDQIIREQDINGIWQFDRMEYTSEPISASLSDIHTFIYDQGTIIIRMMTTSDTTDLPEDDIYRVATRWNGNTLYIFPPMGVKWELFATWEQVQFVMTGGDQKKYFKKISPEEIAPWNTALLHPGRPLWHYIHLNPSSIDI
jgi:hypothetical protein